VVVDARSRVAREELGKGEDEQAEKKKKKK
jgi:hypothetical protein